MTDMTKSAISLDKIQAEAPGLVNLAKTAAASLEKKGLDGHRAAVYLVLDHSGSMQRYYDNGAVQKLADQTLGLSVNVDDDGTVPVVLFDDSATEPFGVSLANYSGAVERLHRQRNWGYTNYADAMSTVITHYCTSGASDPALVVFQTDGDPYTRTGDARKEAEKALKDASRLPIFWSFVGFGEELTFLRKLDNLRVGFGGRKVDNASLFETGDNPLNVSDAALYDGIMHEYPKWLTDAHAAGIIR